MSALSFQWVLYPFVQPLLNRCGGKLTLAFATCTWFIMVFVGISTTSDTAVKSKFFAPTWTPGFLFGVGAGLFARESTSSSATDGEKTSLLPTSKPPALYEGYCPRNISIVIDVLSVIMVSVVFAAPGDLGSRLPCIFQSGCGSSQASSALDAFFWHHAFTLPLTLWLYLLEVDNKAKSGVAGITMRVLRQPALTSLGAYTLEIYLFHWPFKPIFKDILSVPASGAFTPQGAYAYMFFVILFSCVFQVAVAVPVSTALRRAFL